MYLWELSIACQTVIPWAMVAEHKVNISTCCIVTCTGFPLGLENLENLGKWEGIFQSGKSQGILNRLEKSGKIT